MKSFSKFFSTEENDGLKRNLAAAFLAQGSSLLVSVLMSLVVPKVMGIEDYSYWQLFLLYSTYTGMLLFGVNDGIYLRLGGSRYDDLNKRHLNGEIVSVSIVQVSLLLVLAVPILFSDLEPERIFVLMSVLAFGFFSNINGVIGYIFQCVNLTNLYSRATIINKILFLIMLSILILANHAGFRQLIIAFVCCQAASLVFTVICARRIITARPIINSTILRHIFDDVVAGFKISVAYYASSLILGVVRILVDYSFGLEEFGFISFALSIATFVLAFIGQVSMVIFPILKRHNQAKRRETYFLIKGLICVFVPLVYLVYVPACLVLAWWLPEYTSSLVYFGLLLPICVLDGKVNLLNTYLKIFREENAILFINVISLLISLALSSVGIVLLDSVSLAIVGAVIAIVFRSSVATIYLEKKYMVEVQWLQLASEVGLCVVFLLSLLFSYQYTVLTTALSLAGYYVINRSSVYSAFNQLIHKNSPNSHS